MRRKCVIAAFAFLLIHTSTFSQKDTLVKKLDSLNTSGNIRDLGKNNNTNPTAYNDSTRFTVHNYFVLLGSDFKQEVTYPFHAKKKDWTKVAIFGGVATALAFADESVSKSFVSLANRSHTVSSASNFITSFGGLYEVYSIAGLTSYGFIFKNEKIKSTAFLATQSYIIAGAIESVLKFLSKRQRPDYIDPRTNEPDPVFHGPFYKFSSQLNGTSNSSFPSGHTTAVFAAATVYAMEYRHHPWIPIVSYSFATLVGLSRLTENKHWPTDVLVGAALGYLTGRQVVNNYHRYMKIKQPERPLRHKKGEFSFNLQPFYGQLLPGVTYNFK